MRIFSFIAVLTIMAIATTGAYRYIDHDWVLYRQALSFIAQKAYSRAVPICEDLVKKDFRTLESLKLLGESYEGSGNIAGSIAAFNRLARLNPDDRQIRYRLGGLYEQKGDQERAASIYRELLRKEPGNRAVAMRLARTLTAMGRYDDAILLYKDILGEKQ